MMEIYVIDGVGGVVGVFVLLVGFADFLVVVLF